MTRDEIREETEIELEAIRKTISELLELAKDIGDKEPNVREKTTDTSIVCIV